MADFVQTMKDWRRMCKVYSVDGHECDECPLENLAPHSCGAIFEGDFADAVDWGELEDRVMTWAEAYPEPKYPSWYRWLIMIGAVGSVDDLFSDLQRHIPADIAEKLGLQPEEG